MKKTKRNYVIIALIIVLLSLAIGYAVLNDQLTISGTANVKGTFDLVFQNPEALDATYSNAALRPVGASNASIAASTTVEDQLDVAVELAHPGAGQAFKVDIKNNSNVEAICTGLNFSENDEDLEVYYPIAANGLDKDQTIAAGDTFELIFYVKWKADSTNTNADKTVNFTATFDYEQNVGEFQGDATNYQTR